MTPKARRRAVRERNADNVTHPPVKVYRDGTVVYRDELFSLTSGMLSEIGDLIVGAPGTYVHEWSTDDQA